MRGIVLMDIVKQLSHNKNTYKHSRHIHPGPEDVSEYRFFISDLLFNLKGKLVEIIIRNVKWQFLTNFFC